MRCRQGRRSGGSCIIFSPGPAGSWPLWLSLARDAMAPSRGIAPCITGGVFFLPPFCPPPPPGPQGLYMPGKHSTTETNPSSQALMLIFFLK